MSAFLSAFVGQLGVYCSMAWDEGNSIGARRRSVIFANASMALYEGEGRFKIFDRVFLRGWGRGRPHRIGYTPLFLQIHLRTS